MLNVPAELRAIERHALAMELQYSYQFGGVNYVGTGRTRDLGGEIISFETDQSLRGAGELELRIPWPFMLHSICPLELVVKGSLVRKDPGVAVLRVKTYEFRTHGERSFSQLANCGITCDIAA
jgi:hypothetical protein